MLHFLAINCCQNGHILAMLLPEKKVAVAKKSWNKPKRAERDLNSYALTLRWGICLLEMDL